LTAKAAIDEDAKLYLGGSAKIQQGIQGSPDGAIPPSMSDMADPFVALARASAVTTTLKLGTGICLVPERNPLLLAKEIATLDHFSNGRFLFGIGAGWLQEETEIMGGDFAHRWSQTREAILVMKELWSKEEAEYHGTFYDFPPVRSFPKPSQQPHPPVWITGRSPQNIREIAERGYVLGTFLSGFQRKKRGRILERGSCANLHNKPHLQLRTLGIENVFL